MMTLMCVGGDTIKSRHMALFNEFHRVRRAANAMPLSDALKQALSWIELLDKIDAHTTLKERFELCGTNSACRHGVIELAKEHGARLTMHAILSVCKGGHTATYRTRDGYGWSGEQFGNHLAAFTSIKREDLNPMNQFRDGKRKIARAPDSPVAQFEDLMQKRTSLIKLSIKNFNDATERGLSNAAWLYSSVAVLHEQVLSIMHEAVADGSIEAIRASLEKLKPFCDEASATESEIVKILESDADDAAPRVFH